MYNEISKFKFPYLLETTKLATHLSSCIKGTEQVQVRLLQICNCRLRLASLSTLLVLSNQHVVYQQERYLKE